MLDILFPRFRNIGNTPVVIGSSVPACPAFFIPRSSKNLVAFLEYGPFGLFRITNECSLSSSIVFFGVLLIIFTDFSLTKIFMFFVSFMCIKNYFLCYMMFIGCDIWSSGDSCSSSAGAGSSGATSGSSSPVGLTQLATIDGAHSGHVKSRE